MFVSYVITTTIKTVIQSTKVFSYAITGTKILKTIQLYYYKVECGFGYTITKKKIKKP